MSLPTDEFRRFKIWKRQKVEKTESPYSEDKLKEFLAKGGTIQQCAMGESGGADRHYKLLLEKGANGAKATKGKMGNRGPRK